MSELRRSLFQISSKISVFFPKFISMEIVTFDWLESAVSHLQKTMKNCKNRSNLNFCSYKTWPCVEKKYTLFNSYRFRLYHFVIRQSHIYWTWGKYVSFSGRKPKRLRRSIHNLKSILFNCECKYTYSHMSSTQLWPGIPKISVTILYTKIKHKFLHNVSKLSEVLRRIWSG